METTGNNMPFTGAKYREDENSAEYFENGFCVAQLDFDADVFENYNDANEDEKDYYYSQMIESKNTYEYNFSMSA